MNSYCKIVFGFFFLLSSLLIGCSPKKSYEEETLLADNRPVEVSIEPEVIESKDTFRLGEKIKAKAYLSRTDYKTLALQNGIKNYMTVHFYHGEHILQIDSIEKFQQAPVEFDTAYIEFEPKKIKSDFEIVAYPYDVIIELNYDEDHEGYDTAFVWRQEALIKNKQ